MRDSLSSIEVSLGSRDPDGTVRCAVAGGSPIDKKPSRKAGQIRCSFKVTVVGLRGWAEGSTALTSLLYCQGSQSG